jgi:hypothetical protein
MSDLDLLQQGIRAVRRGHLEPARHLLDRVLAERPDDEVALSWRARAAEEPGEQAGFLRRALAVNLDNRWAAQTLQAVESGEPVTPAGPIARPGERSRPSLEQLQCPSCGGTVEIHPDRGPKAVVCQYCGSVLDLTADQLDILGQTDPKERPSVPIEPGMAATFGGVEHLVIGWVRYRGWDSEDQWEWDEWQLVDAHGTPHYLSHDETGFSLQTRVEPLKPFYPASSRSIAVPDGVAYVKERGPAKIIALRGELTWRPRLGQMLKVLDATGPGGTVYSAEYGGDEIELVGGPRLSDEAVWRAFGRADLARKAKQEVAREGERGRLAVVCLVATIVFLIGAWFTAFTGTNLLDGYLELEQPAGAPTLAEVNADGRTLVGTFDVSKPGRAHKVKLRTNPPGIGGWAEVEVWVTEPSGTRHPVGVASFWEEEGYEDGERWHEHDVKESFLFRPAEAGPHRLEVASEATVTPLPLSVDVLGGVWLARYFLIAAALASLAAFLFLPRTSSSS